MSTKVSSAIPAPRGPAANPGASFGARTAERAQGRSEIIELALFWAFVAGLAWVPYWFGSNDYFAWGVNAVLFCGLVAIYEVAVVVRGKSHPVSVKEVWISAALFAAVVLWIVIQNATWTPTSWHHPIWQLASDALKKPIEGSISVNRNLTIVALVRLITFASVFWLALQLCRDGARAKHLMAAIAVIVCGYSAYGIIAVALNAKLVHWMGTTWSLGAVNSTFVNRTHFGTYAGIGLVVVCGLILKLYRSDLTTRGGSLRFRIASIIEASAQQGAILIGAAFLIFVALLGSASRGAILSTGLGLLVLAVLLLGGRDKGFIGRREILIFVGLLGVVVFLAFGDMFVGKMTESGLSDDRRLAVYVIVLRSIFDAPLLGYGYGTFIDVFPMFRDRSISIEGALDQAHNTYLEVFQDLGLVFGLALVACVVLLVIKCFKGTKVRREGVMVPAVATGIAFLVGVHALADFSLQIQAVTLTFAAILGAGVAQSKNSWQIVSDRLQQERLVSNPEVGSQRPKASRATSGLPHSPSPTMKHDHWQS
jgi:O-antigen ligase